MKLPWHDESTAVNGQPVCVNFRAWFGRSRAVDAEGQPLVCLHGTALPPVAAPAPGDTLPPGAFDAFDKRKRGWVSDSSDAKVGFWFTTSERRALAAAREAQVMSETGQAAPYVYRVALLVENPLVLASIRDTWPADVARLARKARRDGHDGLIFRQGEDGGMDLMVFEPWQIKSLQANAGLFVRGSASLTDRDAARVLQLGAQALAPMQRTPARGRAPQ